jgi:alkylhydroperoxidase family enzyme
MDYVLSRSGRGRRELIEQALALARSRPASRELIDALDALAWDEFKRSGDARACLGAIDEALQVCEEQGWSAPAFLIATRGAVRCALGDAGGLDDQRRALQLLEDSDQQRFGFELSNSMCNYVILSEWVAGAKATQQASRDCIDFLGRRGMVADALLMRAGSFESRLMVGDWATLAEDLATSEREIPEALYRQNVHYLKAVKLCHGAWTGQTEGLDAVLIELAALRASYAFASDLAYDLVPSAAGLAALGRPDEATGLLEEWAATPQPVSTVEYAWLVPEAVRVALRCSGLELAERLQHRGDGLLPVQQHVMASVAALLAEAHGEYEAAAAGFADAARRWHDFGVPYEEGQALFGQGRCLVALGRAHDAAAPLAAARELFARLGAKPALTETDKALTDAGTNEEPVP